MPKRSQEVKLKVRVSYATTSPDSAERLSRCFAILLRPLSDESSKSTTDVDYVEQQRGQLNGI